MVHTPKGLRTINRRKITCRINNDGYVEIRLSKGGNTKTCFIHVLLAQVFIVNPENKPEVNHIDGIKTNNTLSNLEWVTHAENMQHAYAGGLWKVPDITKHKLYDGCLNVVFDSIREAADYYGINHSTLRDRLRRKSKKRGCLNYLAKSRKLRADIRCGIEYLE